MSLRTPDVENGQSIITSRTAVYFLWEELFGGSKILSKIKVCYLSGFRSIECLMHS